MDFWKHLQRLFCSYISTFCASVVWCTNLFLWWDKEKGAETVVLNTVKRYLSRQEYLLNSGLVLPCQGQGNFYLVWEIQAESCRRKCRICILSSLGPCRQEFGESAYMEKELLRKKLSWLLWKKNFFADLSGLLIPQSCCNAYSLGCNLGQSLRWRTVLYFTAFLFTSRKRLFLGKQCQEFMLL